MEILSTYAMNPRRIEAGIMNYGTDMGWDTTPFDLGLGALSILTMTLSGGMPCNPPNVAPVFRVRDRGEGYQMGIACFAGPDPVGRVKRLSRRQRWAQASAMFYLKMLRPCRPTLSR